VNNTDLVQQRPFWNQVDNLKKTPARQIGFGSVPGATREEKIQRFIGAMKRNMQCPSVNVPNIDTVTVHYNGPLSPANTTAAFGATINPLGASVETPPPGASQVDSTFAEPGKFQTFALVTAIQWRFDVDPIAFTAKCNALQLANNTTLVAKPVSPDFWVNSVAGAGTGDTTTSATAPGPLGLAVNQSMIPAVLEWAWWAEMGFFYMSRGYNLQWQYGHSFNLLNDKLHYTAYMPSVAQNGSASSSEIDLALFLNRMNQYYVGTLGSTVIGIAIDRMRAGNDTLGGVAGLSTFHPTRAFDTIGGTYGGTGLQSILQGNKEFRKLAVPFLAWPGVPLGLKLQVQSTVDQILMQQQFDATSGFGGAIPGSFADSPLLLNTTTIAGTTGTTGVELSLDPAGALAESLQVPTGRTIFKGSPWRMTVAFKGWELSPEQAEMIRQDDGVRASVGAQCGCTVASPGGVAL
jgi:hypothetical protein